MRGAAIFLLCVFAGTSGAQLSGTASVASDYRYRGITFSDRKPAVQAGFTYDDPLGWYAGAFGSTVRLPPSTGPNLHAIVFAGIASRLQSGITLEAGADYSTFTATGRYRYGEIFVGAASENVGARIYYSPRYFGQSLNAVYGEINGSQALVEHVRLLVHLGFLSTGQAAAYGEVPDRRVFDGRIGLGFDLDPFHLELAWVGVSPASAAYPISGSRSPGTVVVTLTRSF